MCCRELVFTRLNISSGVDTATFSTVYRMLVRFSLAHNMSRGGGGRNVSRGGGGRLPQALLPILLHQTAQAYGIWEDKRWEPTRAG